MRSLFRFLCVAATVAVATMSAFAWENSDSILYWQIGETGNTVDDGPSSVYTFLGFDHADDEIGVRIACYDKYGNLIKHLNPVYPDSPDVPGGIDWEYNDQIIGTRDDFWMTRASQAYYGPNDYMERLFQMQVGNYDEDYNFNPLLWTRGELVDGKHWYDTGSLLPPGTDWIPVEFYTSNPVVPVGPAAPEANSGIMFIIGIGLLMLQRKKFNMLDFKLKQH